MMRNGKVRGGRRGMAEEAAEILNTEADYNGKRQACAFVEARMNPGGARVRKGARRCRPRLFPAPARHAVPRSVMRVMLMGAQIQ